MQARCTDCGSFRLRLCRDGFETCTDCGLEVNDCRIEDKAEHRNYDDGVERNHYGSGPTQKEIAADKPRLGTMTPKTTSSRTFATPSWDQALDRHLAEMRTRMAGVGMMTASQERAETFFVKDWNARKGRRGVKNNDLMAACMYIATDCKHSIHEITARFNTTVKKVRAGMEQLYDDKAVPSPSEVHDNHERRANKYTAEIQSMMPGLTASEKMRVGRDCEAIDNMAVERGVRGSKHTSIYNKAVVLVALEKSGRMVDRQILAVNANLNSVNTILEHRNEILGCLEEAATDAKL